ncbi:MAG: hypothetical protein VXW87_02685 [Pseudomonadota bacterium]|nr:hypothetical protein [Pseudomonadota bacterium]
MQAKDLMKIVLGPKGLSQESPLLKPQCYHQVTSDGLCSMVMLESGIKKSLLETLVETEQGMSILFKFVEFNPNVIQDCSFTPRRSSLQQDEVSSPFWRLALSRLGRNILLRVIRSKPGIVSENLLNCPFYINGLKFGSAAALFACSIQGIEILKTLARQAVFVLPDVLISQVTFGGYTNAVVGHLINCPEGVDFLSCMIKMKKTVLSPKSIEVVFRSNPPVARIVAELQNLESRGRAGIMLPQITPLKRYG